MSEALASGMYPVNRTHLLKLLVDFNVSILAGSKVLKISDSGVVITDKSCKKKTLQADSIILAVGFKPDDSLLKIVKNKISETHAIGDCINPKDVSHAIRSAFRAARLI